VSSPDVRWDTAPIMRMVDDFPAPLGPSKPKDSPLVTSKLTASTAVLSPNFLVRSRAIITGAVAGGGMAPQPSAGWVIIR